MEGTWHPLLLQLEWRGIFSCVLRDGKESKIIEKKCGTLKKSMMLINLFMWMFLASSITFIPNSDGVA